MECFIGNCNEQATKGVTWNKETWYACDEHLEKMRVGKKVPEYIDSHNYIEDRPKQEIMEEGFFIAVEVDDVDSLSPAARYLIMHMMQNFRETVVAVNNVDGGELRMSVNMTQKLMEVALSEPEPQEEDADGIQ